LKNRRKEISRKERVYVTEGSKPSNIAQLRKVKKKTPPGLGSSQSMTMASALQEKKPKPESRLRIWARRIKVELAMTSERRGTSTRRGVTYIEDKTSKKEEKRAWYIDD